jgi:hypothetical protein
MVHRGEMSAKVKENAGINVVTKEIEYAAVGISRDQRMFYAHLAFRIMMKMSALSDLPCYERVTSVWRTDLSQACLSGKGSLRYPTFEHNIRFTSFSEAVWPFDVTRLIWNAYC